MRIDRKRADVPQLVRVYQPEENKHKPENHKATEQEVHTEERVKIESVSEFVDKWKTDFVKRMRTESKSRKRNFSFYDAKQCTALIESSLDKSMLLYLDFLKSNPLLKNDYFKFVNSYRNGKKLNEKYFRHDIKKLHEYYKKVDENKEYNPFSKTAFERYVLFMILKFFGEYRKEYDEVFYVKIDESREYNPLTAIPSVLRQTLPFRIKEYDIKQAYPSFIFIELGIDPFDVYERIDKRSFNMLLNMHHEVKGATIEAVRSKLKPIYKDRVSEVITEERFNNKGQMFRDLAKYEADYIQKFVTANNPENYVRLHDGVVVLESMTCDVLNFGIVQFKEKEFKQPEFKNQTVNFYEFSEEGKLITSPVTYSRFLEQEGFIRITQENRDQITILRNENKIVQPINHKTDLVPFFKENINEFETDFIEDRIARDASNTIIQSLQLIDPIPLKYHKDTKERVDIPFKNGIARVTVDDIQIISYDEIDGFFAKHNTQKHLFSLNDVDADVSDFEVFLQMAITGRDVIHEPLTAVDWEKIFAFFSMIGYLISNYKDPASVTAIVLSDENADGESRNGGRGKSLLQQALKHFRCAIEKGGNAYDPNYTHVHADLKREHDLYLLDDVPHNFDYNALYTQITGSFDAQRKGVTAETISFEDAPKFVISTNWVFRYDKDATSTNRRFKEYKFSNFWNIENRPVDRFRKSFFTDWNEKEWNDFYNFGLRCVQYYLKNGLQGIEYDKRTDNYLAYFYNDSILEEVQRIFQILETQGDGSFSVSEFVEHHRNRDLYRYKPEFSIRNTKKYIDAYIEFNKLPYEYVQRERKWKVNRNKCNAVTDDVTDKNELMF